MFDGIDDDAGSIAGVGFLEYTFPVAFDGADAEVQGGGYFFI